MKRKLQVYKSDALVVTFDPTLCIHAADCVRGLPAVFDTRRVAWIKVDAAPAEAIVEVVARCPTGALQAIQLGKPPVPARATNGDAESGSAAEPRVRVELKDHGPVVIRGPVDFEPELGRVEPREGTFSLCRCGRSRSFPFCDGSHGGR